MINIRNLDLRFYAVISMLVLWASLTFSIALTEISFVCALVFWVGWHIQRRKWSQPSRSFPHVLSGTGSQIKNFNESECRTKLPVSNQIVVQCGNPERGSPTLKGRCVVKAFGDDKNTIDWGFWAPLALFFMLVLVSYFTSEYPKESLRGLLKIAKPLLAFIMAIDLFGDPRSQKRFDRIFLATFLLVVIDCSIQYAFGKDILRGFAAEQSGAGIRLIGPFGNFAKMATYLVLVIPVFGLNFWSKFAQSEQRGRSFYDLALTFAGFVLLYLTRCRGPVVALVLSFGILFVYKRWFKALGITILLCLALLAVMPRAVLVHLDAEKKERSAMERMVLWKRALNVIEAKPWTGTGINTYSVAHQKYDTIQQKNLMLIHDASTTVRQNPDGSVSFIAGKTILTSDEKQAILWNGGKKYNLIKEPDGKYYIYNDLRVRGYYAHNGYLQLAAEIGLPGVFFFLLFLFMFLRKVLGGLRAIRNTPEEYARLGILTGLLAFLIYAAGDNNLQSPPSLMFYWFSAGILMARQSAARSGVSSSTKP